MNNDGSGLEDHKITREQERLVIYTNRLYDTLGGQAADAIELDFGLPALLAEKCSMEIEQDKQKAEGKDPDKTAVEHLFEMMSPDHEREDSEEEDTCQCAACRIRRGEGINNFKAVMAMLRSNAERDLAEQTANCPTAHLPSLIIQTFYRALAMGYVLGRDEKEIKSGTHDDDLDKLDRMNALREIDKELLISEAVMEATSNQRKGSPLGAILGQHMSLAFEERRDMIRMSKKFIENGIIPVKEIRNIVDRCQTENLLGFFGGGNAKSLLSKIEDELSSKEAELRRLKEALG
jgi:hypothetical protein